VTAVPEDYTENMPSSSGSTNVATSISSHEDNLAGRVAKTNQTSKENQKMIKISDKLIGVFMVDKPTPTDWRKLLSFSREWDNIRPHFFKRCQERADAESNPEMKHNLLRLARKLKEIDEDVQRHNELLEVVKSTPSDEIGSVIAKRHKDFTVEFFNHLYYVAESYHDDPEKQRGETYTRTSICNIWPFIVTYVGTLHSFPCIKALVTSHMNHMSRNIDTLHHQQQLFSSFLSPY
jgi:hypothetical protein